jgi:hypothetical protein
MEKSPRRYLISVAINHKKSFKSKKSQFRQLNADYVSKLAPYSRLFVCINRT